MSKARGDVHGFAVCRSKFDCDPATKSGRLWTQIKQYVINRPSGAAHKFRFAMWLCLIVHSAERAAALIVGNAVLNELNIQAEFLHRLSAPRPGKEPAFV